MKRLFSIFKNTTFQLWLVLFFLFALGATLYWFLKFSPEQLGITEGSALQGYLLFANVLTTGALVLFILLFFIVTRLFGEKDYKAVKAAAAGGKATVESVTKKEDNSKSELTTLKTHLRRRYGLFWRYKVRLLWVTGDG